MLDKESVELRYFKTEQQVKMQGRKNSSTRYELSYLEKILQEKRQECRVASPKDQDEVLSRESRDVQLPGNYAGF